MSAGSGYVRQRADQPRPVLKQVTLGGLHALAAAPRSRRPLAWPISSSMTREGMAASSSQVANVCRRSCGPRRSRWPRSAPAASTAALQTRRRLLARPRRRNAYRGRGGRNHHDPRSSPCYDEWPIYIS